MKLSDTKKDFSLFYFLIMFGLNQLIIAISLCFLYVTDCNARTCKQIKRRNFFSLVNQYRNYGRRQCLLRINDLVSSPNFNDHCKESLCYEHFPADCYSPRRSRRSSELSQFTSFCQDCGQVKVLLKPLLLKVSLVAILVLD